MLIVYQCNSPTMAQIGDKKKLLPQFFLSKIHTPWSKSTRTKPAHHRHWKINYVHIWEIWGGKPVHVLQFIPHRHSLSSISSSLPPLLSSARTPACFTSLNRLRLVWRRSHPAAPLCSQLLAMAWGSEARGGRPNSLSSIRSIPRWAVAETKGWRSWGVRMGLGRQRGNKKG